MGVKIVVENRQVVPLVPLRQIMHKASVFYIGTLVAKHGKERQATEEESWHCWSASGDGTNVVDLARMDEWWCSGSDFDLDASTGRLLQPGERLGPAAQRRRPAHGRPAAVGLHDAAGRAALRHHRGRPQHHHPFASRRVLT